MIRLQSPSKQASPSNFAIGEGGCAADADFSADRGHVSRPGILLLPGLPGEMKLLEKRASSLSDAPRVYIDRGGSETGGSGRQIPFRDSS
jgi:hypothetical protein